MRITLASQSPRRRELLAQLGFDLEIRPAMTDETPRAGESPRDYVLRVAKEKARAVDGAAVVGADTAVVLRGAILGKPRDDEDARRMLRGLSGADHEVLTAVVARCTTRGYEAELATVVSTEVSFATLSEEQIAWYVSTGEPRDKAGAYAVQGIGGAFVREIAGSVTNVVGLPVAETLELLRRLGAAMPWKAP